MIGFFRRMPVPLSVIRATGNFLAYRTGEGGQYKSGSEYTTLAEWINAGGPLCQRLPKDKISNGGDDAE